MRDNLNKVQERGENLNDLQGKTDNLAVSAGQFRRGANRVRKQMWWKVRPRKQALKRAPQSSISHILTIFYALHLSGHEDANLDYRRYHHSPLDHHLCVLQNFALHVPEVSNRPTFL